ncbi:MULTISPECIES: 1-deoxy-D-xylulose-5-phosphate synthase [Streptomyces]|uniref:1-deoxy-D-xylulose-5-phosphate synthase n=1 Tax=Streptomyces stelliscabiei TaxID=146820 RepID=A0A8I0PCZ6_9ACTN|nr:MULTISPECIES: 1-deoxy-D-xylulose-5-phosphate synthase [Streptomyces]KND44620.1 1-deoxy-D-xylulose-5-phosphate synthase [Streptomyces stelliscabiei]MBE1601742.1 1-deoxy-D-xylulose-5-phosphate synthase [Streptomyces stelliscabiei]MDX2514950.1 1-deoxy-D-xylulose-5-phosphate synthase [Streptomyces stelliscabiei]MDX2555358.1 1-deoxy-D-xylulose-5-phosphate synthase [Streptomyces stelliscabiei]MDX2613047.1 1-deoxy-D-xylulose-5-phosphate synthase [Streptomyces stelliscabiei]
MTILESIRQPRDLKALTEAELGELAEEIREFLVHAVARTGGHLGPNLGVVELSVALHRVFESPVDRIVWDTGHQSYVHKLLTGRQDFSKLRGKGGLSGYPSRAESEHDIVENSHASTALGWADGLAKARQVLGERGHVVAVIGDGALTGGMAWEALNNIAAAKDRPLIIVVNDNERSYSPTIGGLANHLATLRTTDGYEQFLAWGKEVLLRTPVVGKEVYEALHGAKKGFKDAFAPQGMFEDLGLKYVGPIDGHDIKAVESALRRAKRFHGPVLVHCLTQKGRGYEPALANEEDHFHTVGVMDPMTCEPLTPAGGPSWTSVFGDEIVRIGDEREDVVAVTAAMLHPVGLGRFAEKFPDRVWDVGIAEQHATVSAAGLATGGLHPVVAVYATFLNRAFDQLLMDVALHRCGVTFVLDRAGVTGVDGASHNGMWDMSVLQVVPGLRIAAPRDAEQLRTQLREAVAVDDAPTLIRFPKESVGPEIPSLERVGGMDVLHRSASSDDPAVLLVAVGVMASVCLRAAELLEARGIGCTVVDPRWVKPVDPALPWLADAHRLVAVVEDNSRAAGVGSAVALALGDAEVDVPVRRFGIPEQFLPHAKRGEVLADIGLTPVEIAGRISASLAAKGESAKGNLPVAKPSVAVLPEAEPSSEAVPSVAKPSEAEPSEAEPSEEKPQ